MMHLFLNRIGRYLEKLGCYAFASVDKVDVVYTWVDGSDPDFCNRLAQYRDAEPNYANPYVAGPRRFRDNDELRYSLRSLEAHAPWINRVFLVTCGQTPVWLKQDHPRLRMVHHEEIFPNKADLPTFNSATIEMHLHRIPGLSRQFLYFNDDIFLGRLVDRNDFFSSSGKPKFWVEPWRLPLLTEASKDLVWSFLAYNHQLLKIAFAEHDYAALPHMPILYDRNELKKIKAFWRREFNRTSSLRFRQKEMFLLHVLYTHYQATLNQCELVLTNHEDCQFVMFHPPMEKIQIELEEIRRTKPKFFGINDDWDDRGESQNAVLRHFLNDYFPTPSSFEK